MTHTHRQGSAGRTRLPLDGRLFAGLGLAATLALGLAPLNASAATTDSSIGVTSTIEATCLNVATALGFATYTGLEATATATITITCTNTTDYSVGLGIGTGTAATETARAMTGTAAAQLLYTLSSDASHTTNWGTTAGAVAGTGTGVGQPLTVYGLVAAGQYIAPGVYTDTITATVTY